MHRRTSVLRGCTAAHLSSEDAPPHICPQRMHRRTSVLRGCTAAHLSSEDAPPHICTQRMHRRTSVLRGCTAAHLSSEDAPPHICPQRMHRRTSVLRGCTAAHLSSEDAPPHICPQRMHRRTSVLRGCTAAHLSSEDAPPHICPQRMHRRTSVLRGCTAAHLSSEDAPPHICPQMIHSKYNADYDLSAKEGADSLAFISLLEEKLMPALIYTFWVEPKNYVDVTRRWYAEHMPFPFNFFLPGRMQRTQLEKLRLLRGDESLEAGEELEKELFRDATECMNLLSQRLGSQKFFFGDSPSSLDAYVFGHLAPILKSKLPNGKLQQHLKSLDNLTNFCTNILLLYFPRDGRESSSQKTSSQPEGGDFDHVPNKRRKQFMSVLVALGAMLSYALLTGMVSIQHAHQEALEEPPDLQTLRAQDHEEDEEEDG
ncbi:metaxin-1a [Scomber scombrus]|uniref:Metaxin-1 n=1 Tax=Scomber scombrus TaxID=13677 RepID=A0AAV1QKS6_SCOSC